MESCLYEGSVRHRRFGEVGHRFAFPLCMLYLDLDELPELFRDSRLWSAERPAFAWFRRGDHLGDPARPLDRCVRELVERRTGQRPTGPIRLLTQPRFAGYAMNPLSVYYCFAPDGRRVESLVAEVTNTPWGERHCYVMRADAARDGRALRADTPKALHVSPFLPMEQSYRWSVREPGRRLSLRIASHAPDGSLAFDAVLALGRRRPLDARGRARALLRYPLMTLQILGGIYGQALRLHRKGARFHPHPRHRATLLETAS